MKTLVIATLQVEGVHRWPNAPDAVGYLREAHRHVFHITVKKKVSHSDREIEIIQLKHKIAGFLRTLPKYEGDKSVIDFESSSCEDIATGLLTDFDLDYCSVLEDGENGAEVWA